MTKPLLTVCIITYNHVQYIREAIDSILAQKVNFGWQLVIADDCSTDGTRDILKEYQHKYPSLIHLILQKKNVGPEHNWMDLLSFPKTKYVLYGEADDYFADSSKLQRQVDFLESHPDFTVCFHPVRVVYEDGSRPDELFPTVEQRYHKNVLTLRDLLNDNFIQTNSAMYRWRFTEQKVTDVFPKGVAPGDWFLHLLHAELGKIGYIDRVMAVYRRHPGGVWWNALKDKDQIWKKHGVPYLRFHIELLKQHGGNAEYRPVIYDHIADTLSVFIAYDEKHHDTLLHDVLAHFPEHTNDLIQSQNHVMRSRADIIRFKDNELADERAGIKKLHEEMHNTQERLQQVTHELSLIKRSPFWKARNRIAKMMGKEVV